MIFSLIRSGANPIEIVRYVLIILPAIVIGLTFHEFAHGYVAYKLGDNTANYAGRLTLNPLAHFDLVGTLAILFFFFGWAKPVPVNFNRFKNYRRDTILVSLAGVAANLLVAVAATVVYAALISLTGYSANAAPVNMMDNVVDVIVQMLYAIIQLNIMLMLFNLIPIPPLDGSKVLITLLPPRAYNFVLNYERYGTILLVIAVVSGALDFVSSIGFAIIQWDLNTIGMFIYNLF